MYILKSIFGVRSCLVSAYFILGSIKNEKNEGN